ncbi:MAG TPA: succinylglutamate desuccinylase/aspartoacylase family protein [Acetobacteraceae bacterium]
MMEAFAIPGLAPGTMHTLPVWRFGVPGAHPKIYVQAGLHADEVPGLLAAQHLLGLLQAHAEAGRIQGEIIVVPMANPIGLQQRVMGGLAGRFSLADGVNFNRAYPDLASAVASGVADLLGPDAAANVSAIRAALLQANAAAIVHTPAEHLKRTLLGLALDADLVLDLHCENAGVVHLYALTPLVDRCRPLAALLGAQALLLAEESGGHPFDEACSQPWLQLQRAFQDHPVPLACCAVTVELRGDADVSHGLAAADAEALVNAMILAGAVDAPVPRLPLARCRPTNLADVELLLAPAPGILVMHRTPGARVGAGDLVAEIVDPVTGGVSELRPQYSGLMFAHESVRFVAAGRSVAKIAGTEAGRSGALLGA